jgi:DHA1 family bicyclomycin/chloramphenicol resistance-like MFS transporter
MKLKFLPLLLIFSLINSCIELEISAPSFPAIMKALQVSEHQVGLTITYNLIGFCLAAVIYGPLSEVYGRRRIMLIGNAILTVGAVACVIAPSIGWLLAARFVQGFGAATSAVVVSTIVADLYPADKAARLYGVMNAMFTSLMAIAPVVGGLINAMLGWRGTYGVVAVICMIAWILLYFFLPETKTSPTKLKLNQIFADYGTLFSSTLFFKAAAVPSLLYGCYMAFVAMAPFIYWQAFALPSLDYTLHQGSIVAVFALTSALAGQLITIVNTKKLLHFAVWIAASGSIIMLYAQTSIILTLAMSLFNIGFALIYPLIFARSLTIFPDLTGTASSAIMALRYLLCSVVTALASLLYNGQPERLGVVIVGVIIIVIALVHDLANRLVKD